MEDAIAAGIRILQYVDQGNRRNKKRTWRYFLASLAIRSSHSLPAFFMSIPAADR